MDEPNHQIRNKNYIHAVAIIIAIIRIAIVAIVIVLTRIALTIIVAIRYACTIFFGH